MATDGTQQRQAMRASHSRMIVERIHRAIARSSRACTVYLTQNVPSYHATFGGANSKAQVDVFLGNLQTNANGDATTNNWAAESIGRTKQLQLSGNLSEVLGANGKGTTLNQSSGGSLGFEYLVQPQEFTTLRTGARESDFKVESIIFQGGRILVAPEGSKPAVQDYIRHSFSQRPS